MIDILIKILFVVAMLSLAGIIYYLDHHDTRAKKKDLRYFSKNKPCGVHNCDVHPCDTRETEDDRFTWCRYCEISKTPNYGKTY